MQFLVSAWRRLPPPLRTRRVSDTEVFDSYTYVFTITEILLNSRAYQPESVRTWSQNAEQINAILDIAQANIQKCIDDMGLSAVVIRKAKAVGKHIFPLFI